MSINMEIKAFDELSTLQLYSILKLRNEVFIVEQNCPYLDCDNKDISAFHILMWENEQIVSYARILPPGVSYNGYSSIGRVLTKSTHRRKNFSRKIMNEAIAFCETSFQEPIQISAQLYLKEFYESLGFIVSSSPYLEDDILHISMIKQR